MFEERRKQTQADFDQAIQSLPGGAKLMQDISLAEGEVTAKAEAAAAAQEKLDDLTRIARGDMDEPVLKDARDEKARLQAELDHLNAALDKASKQLTSAQLAKLPTEELKPFQDQAAAAKNQRDAHQKLLEQATEREATAEKLANGDPTTLDDVKKKRKAALEQLDKCKKALKQAQTLTKDPKQLKKFIDMLHAAQRDLTSLDAMIEAGERGARIAATPLPKKRENKKKLEKIRDTLLKNMEDDRTAIFEIQGKNKLGEKISKDDKKTIEAALKKASEKKVELDEAQALLDHCQDQVDDAGGDAKASEKLKQSLAEAKKARDKVKSELETLQDAYADAEKTAMTNVEKKHLSKDDLAALEKARLRISTAESDVKKARTTISQVQKEIAQETDTLAANEKQAFDDANTALTKADDEAQRLSGEFDLKVKGSKQATDALAALEESDGVLERAKAQEADAVIAAAAAQSEDLIARIQQEALDNVTAEKKAFELFADLTSEDFEEALCKGVDNSKIGEKLAKLPEKPSKFKNAQEEKEFNAAYDKAAKQRAEYIEGLRQAQEAMDRLVERNQLLEEAGASFEERKQAFAHIPEAMLPPQFREELKAYRDVEELFADEEEEERIKKARKGEAKESILSTLGELAELAEPVVNMFLDAMAIGGGFSDGKAFESGSFDWAAAVSGAVGAALADKDMFKSEKETLDKTLTPGSDEEAQRRKLLDEDKKIQMLAFMKDFLLAQAKTTGAALDLVKKGMDLSSSSGVAHAIPGLGAVVASIEAAIEIGKATQMSIRAAPRDRFIGKPRPRARTTPWSSRWTINRGGRPTALSSNRCMPPPRPCRRPAPLWWRSAPRRQSPGSRCRPPARDWNTATRRSSSASIGSKPPRPPRRWSWPGPAATRPCRKFSRTTRNTPPCTSAGKPTTATPEPSSSAKSAAWTGRPCSTAAPA